MSSSVPEPNSSISSALKVLGSLSQSTGEFAKRSVHQFSARLSRAPLLEQHRAGLEARLAATSSPLTRSYDPYTRFRAHHRDDRDVVAPSDDANTDEVSRSKHIAGAQQLSDLMRSPQRYDVYERLQDGQSSDEGVPSAQQLSLGPRSSRRSPCRSTRAESPPTSDRGSSNSFRRGRSSEIELRSVRTRHERSASPCELQHMPHSERRRSHSPNRSGIHVPGSMEDNRLSQVKPLGDCPTVPTIGTIQAAKEVGSVVPSVAPSPSHEQVIFSAQNPSPPMDSEGPPTDPLTGKAIASPPSSFPLASAQSPAPPSSTPLPKTTQGPSIIQQHAVLPPPMDVDATPALSTSSLSISTLLTSSPLTSVTSPSPLVEMDSIPASHPLPTTHWTSAPTPSAVHPRQQVNPPPTRTTHQPPSMQVDSTPARPHPASTTQQTPVPPTSFPPTFSTPTSTIPQSSHMSPCREVNSTPPRAIRRSPPMEVDSTPVQAHHPADSVSQAQQQPAATPQQSSEQPRRPMPLTPLSTPSSMMESIVDQIIVQRLGTNVLQPLVNEIVSACIPEITQLLASRLPPPQQQQSGRTRADESPSKWSKDGFDGDDEDEDEDEDGSSAARRRKPGQRGNNALHAAFRRYLREKNVILSRPDGPLPPSAPQSLIRMFNNGGSLPPTLDGIALDWTSASLTNSRWNSEVVSLLTIDFRERLKNGSYPDVDWDVSLDDLRKCCVQKLGRTYQAYRRKAMIDSVHSDECVEMTARQAKKEEKRRKDARMMSRRHGTLQRRKRIVEENRSRDPPKWDAILRLIERLDVQGMSGDETDSPPQSTLKHLRRIELPWINPAISALFKSVESYESSLRDQNMKEWVGNSHLQRHWEAGRKEKKGAAVPALPRNWYDETWFQSLSPGAQSMLRARREVPIPTLCNSPYNSCAERTAV